MKKYIQKILITGIFLSASFVFGQFNTIKPSALLKPDSELSEKPENAEPKKGKKEKKSLKKILGITTKADLRNEMDSLKILMKEFTSFNNLKWDFQNTKDSLILSTQIKSSVNRINKSSFSKYDFTTEPEENFSKIVMPLKGGLSVTSPYGSRIHPIFGTKKMHNGIDLKANYENVYSVMDGIVTETGWDPKGGGNYIKIKHFGRFETSYLHLSEIYYRIGERVNAGFIIAKSGNSGNSTGAHLHFSVTENGKRIDPVRFLNDLLKANNLIATYYAK